MTVGDGCLAERINRNLGMSHPATTATINFYSEKRRLEAQEGRRLTTAEVKERLAAVGKLKDARTDNADAIRGEYLVGGGGVSKNLTWVKGQRNPDELDEASRKNLAAGRRPNAGAFPPQATVIHIRRKL